MKTVVQKTLQSLLFSTVAAITCSSAAIAQEEIRIHPVLDKLFPPVDGLLVGGFGSSLATEGNTLLIGGGSTAYLYDMQSQSYIDTLIPPDAPLGNRFAFGRSVSLSGGKGLIGAPFDNTQESLGGSAYLFDSNNGGFLRKISNPNPTVNAQFGDSVSLIGDLALVGAYGADTYKGAAYLFDTNTGNLLQKLTAPDGEDRDQFGISVALDNDFALIGARGDNRSAGSAYLFDKDSGDFLFKFTAPDAFRGDIFGYSVDVEGQFALIGAYGKNGRTGSAYVFDTMTGSLLHQLSSPDLGIRRGGSDHFGFSLDISGTKAIIGAIADDASGEDRGGAYTFDLLTGESLEFFSFSNLTRNPVLGWSVALGDDGEMIIGSPGDDELLSSPYRQDNNYGAVYISQALASGNDDDNGDGGSNPGGGGSNPGDSGSNPGNGGGDPAKVPEPASTVALFALAGAGMLMTRKRQNSTKE